MITVKDYNREHQGKAWEVVAVVTAKSEVLCASCAGDLESESLDYSPVFSSDTFDYYCDRCGAVLGNGLTD